MFGNITDDFAYCLRINHQTAGASRTDMGPNLYISPRKSLFGYTHFRAVAFLISQMTYLILTSLNCDEPLAGGSTDWHRDGNGTVDSGHINLHGYNEVVILRRLPEEHHENAMTICTSLIEGTDDSFNSMPHDRKEFSPWATRDVIQKFKTMKYVNLVFP